MTIVWWSLECCSMIMVQQSLKFVLQYDHNVVVTGVCAAV